MLLRVRHFAESASMAVRQKHGLVAKTLIAPRGPHEDAVHRSLEPFHVSVGPSQTQRAEELSLALARRVRAALVQSVFHRLHGAPEVLFGTRPARRVYAWLAAERVDGQSGIIRERRQTQGRCRSACLDAGVRLERRAALRRLVQAELGRPCGIDSERHEKLAHFLELAWIVRGDHQAPGNLSMSRAF